MKHSLETQVMSHLYQTGAIYWWRAIKHFGCLNILDLIEGYEDLNRADLEILKQSGVVTIERTRHGTFVKDIQNDAKMALYVSLMNIMDEKDRPKTLTDGEHETIGMLLGSGGFTLDECLEQNMQSRRYLEVLVRKGFVVQCADGHFRARYAGNERVNDGDYNLERNTRLRVFQHELRWGDRR